MTKNRGALDYLFDRTTLIGSIQSQDVEAIEDWLKAHPGKEELNRPFRQTGYTPLYMAVLLQNMDVVQTLIFHGADPTCRNGCGQTVLHRAFEYLREKKVRDIILALAEIRDVLNIADNRGCTALHLAIEQGDLPLLDHFIRLGADISLKTSEGEGIVFFALRRGKDSIAELLINKGAETDFWAHCASGNHDAVAERLRKQPNLVSTTLPNGTSPLHIAAVRRSAVVVQLLLDRGADINAVDDKGESALFKTRDKETARVLINAGANVNASNEGGETPLFHAPNAELATMYLDSGADINHRDTFGFTALHTAVSNAAGNSTDIEVIKCLLEHGAVVDAQDDGGKTSLRCAVKDSDDRIVRILLAYGADPVPLFAPIYECCSSGQIDFGFSAAETKALMLEAGYSDGDVRSMFDKYRHREFEHGD